MSRVTWSVFLVLVLLHGVRDTGYTSPSSPDSAEETGHSQTDRREWCRVVRVAIDRDFVGSPDAFETTWYDEAGRPTRRWEDSDADGHPERRKTWTYQQGHLVSKTSSHRCDNTDRRHRETTVWTYDRGRRQRSKTEVWRCDRERGSSSDNDRDTEGTLDHVTTWHYDDEGRLIRREKRDPDGELEQVMHWTYESRPEGGFVVRRWKDFEYYEHRMYSATRIVYDETGHIIDKFARRNIGGEHEPTLKWSYDDRGRVTRSTTNHAGRVHEKIYEYNEQGQIIRVTSDRDLSEAADYTATWTYDARGNPVRYEKDAETGEDGYNPSVLKEWRYRPEGCLHPKQADSPGTYDSNRSIPRLDTHWRSETDQSF